MSHLYIVTYLMDGLHEHTRVYADNKRQARKMLRDVMGSRYQVTEVEEVM